MRCFERIAGRGRNQEQAKTRLACFRLGKILAEMGNGVERLEERPAWTRRELDCADPRMGLLKSMESFRSDAERRTDQSATGSSVRHYQNALSCVIGQQIFPEQARAFKEVQHRERTARRGLHAKEVRLRPPHLILFRIPAAHLVKPQPLPFRQIDFFEPVISLQAGNGQALPAKLVEYLAGSVEGPPKWAGDDKTDPRACQSLRGQL